MLSTSKGQCQSLLCVNKQYLWSSMWPNEQIRGDTIQISSNNRRKNLERSSIIRPTSSPDHKICIIIILIGQMTQIEVFPSQQLKLSVVQQGLDTLVILPVYMSKSRIPNIVLPGEVDEGFRRPGRPKKSFREGLRNDLKAFQLWPKYTGCTNKILLTGWRPKRMAKNN